MGNCIVLAIYEKAEFVVLGVCLGLAWIIAVNIVINIASYVADKVRAK